MTRCLFVVLDRDGTLIEHVPYLHSPTGVRLMPHAAEALSLLRGFGCRLFLHTNQSGIGRGLFSTEAAESTTNEMIRQLGLGNGVFDGICMAPEAPEAPIQYRKPSPRYGQEIVARFGITPQDLFYIGDNVTDLQTAANLGCGGAGVDTGGHDLKRLVPANATLRHFPVFDSLMDAARHVVDRVASVRVGANR